MVDKFRKTAPLKVTFAEGEQPSSPKLNALSTQIRGGLGLVENALGDPWNQSGDPVLDTFALQIPNLARMVGQSEYLNPALYPTGADFDYSEELGSKFQGHSQGYFLFQPTEGTSGGGSIPASYTINMDTSGNFVNQVANERDVVTGGEFWVDRETGKFRIFGVLDADTRITYKVSPSADWVLGTETLPGVIPDPGQTEFTSCRFSDISGTFYLHLPPRRPLTLATRERPAYYPPLGGAEETNNTQTVAGQGIPYRYWQGSSMALDGIGDEHYRYELPDEIQQGIGAMDPGDEFPGGFLYIWNTSTNTIIDDVIFKKTSVFTDQPNTIIEVSSSQFDFTTVTTSTEAVADYDSSGLILITCGSPIARSMWTLASAFYRHSHSREGTLDASVRHRDLRGLNPPTSTALFTSEEDAGHDARYPTIIPPWPASRWAHDDHTHLLSRAGSQGTGGGRNRDPNDNAMLGDLVMANSVAIDNVFLDSNNTDTSFKIRFGDNTGAAIYGIPGTRRLRIFGTVSSNIQTATGLTIEGSPVSTSGFPNGRGLNVTGGVGSGGNAGDGGLFTGGAGSSTDNPGRGLLITGGESTDDAATGGIGLTLNGGIGSTGGIGLAVMGGQGRTGGLNAGVAIEATGGFSNGIAIQAYATGNANAIEAFGGGTAGIGVLGEGDGTGEGISGKGSSAGSPGVLGLGTGTSPGITGTGGSGGSGSDGVFGQGIGFGAGISGIGGDDGGNTGPGGLFEGGGSDVGVDATGGPNNGPGVRALGIGGGSGITATGGDSDGAGVAGFGGDNDGHGVIGFGTGAGAGGGFVGGSTGFGLVASGSVERAALLLTPATTLPSSPTAGGGDIVFLDENGTMARPNIYDGTQWGKLTNQVAIITTAGDATPNDRVTLATHTLPTNSLTDDSVITIRVGISITSTGSGDLTAYINVAGTDYLTTATKQGLSTDLIIMELWIRAGGAARFGWSIFGPGTGAPLHTQISGIGALTYGQPNDIDIDVEKGSTACNTIVRFFQVIVT